MTPIDAVARSYRRYRSSVQRAAQNVVRDPHEASDLADDAFLALLEKGPDNEAVHLAWLRRTAHNRAVNRLRRLQRHVPLEDHDAPTDDREPLDGVRELIRAGLERLPERDRVALTARIVDEQDYDIIGEDLGVTTAQTHVIVHRAQQRLRREIVKVLAESHRASEACTRSLVKRLAEASDIQPHLDCHPCMAVTEEVSALKSAAVSLGVLPAAPFLFGFAGKLGEILTRARGLIDRPRVQGAAAAVALAVSLGGGTIPGVVEGPAGDAPRAVAAAPAPSASPAELAAGVPDAATIAAGAAAPSREVGSALSNDPTGDSAFSSAARPLPLRLPDPFGSTRRTDLDATAFEIATLVSDGAATGLQFRLDTVASPLNRGGTFSVSWHFQDAPQCSAQLTVTRRAFQDPTASYLLSCKQTTLTSIEEQTRVPVSIDGRTMTVAVPFSLLGNEGDALHVSGSMLIGLLAETMSSAHMPLLGTGDRVPDDSTIQYRIG